MVGDQPERVSGTNEPLLFAEHKEQTAKDCEAMSAELTKLAARVREGNLAAFEDFIFPGSDGEDAGIVKARELLALRYLHRQERTEP